LTWSLLHGLDELFHVGKGDLGLEIDDLVAILDGLQGRVTFDAVLLDHGVDLGVVRVGAIDALLPPAARDGVLAVDRLSVVGIAKLFPFGFRLDTVRAPVHVEEQDFDRSGGAASAGSGTAEPVLSGSPVGNVARLGILGPGRVNIVNTVSH